MIRARVWAGAAAVAALVLAPLATASTATAATLPAGQRITAIAGDTDEVYEADPATAAVTYVGPGLSAEDTYAVAAEVDDTGFGYVLLSFGDSNGIAPLDANTGVAGEPVGITIPALQSAPYGCETLERTADGIFYTTCLTEGGENGELTHFGTLNPATGEMAVLRTAEGPIQFTALAADPVTGQFWALSIEFANTWIWSVDPETWAFTQHLLTDRPVIAADFDRDGQLFVSTVWGQTGEADAATALATLDPLTGAFTIVGNYTLGGEPFSPDADVVITVWGLAPEEPVLPATGASALPLAIGSALLLLVGAALLVRRRGSV